MWKNITKHRPILESAMKELFKINIPIFKMFWRLKNKFQGQKSSDVTTFSSGWIARIQPLSAGKPVHALCEGKVLEHKNVNYLFK